MDTTTEHAGPHREGCPLRDGGGLAAAIPPIVLNSAPVWRNADGTTSPIVKATADAALPQPAGPSQQFLQALVAAEQDRLRAEGWRTCIEHIRREYHAKTVVDGVVLSGEDLYWIGRHNPYATRLASEGTAAADEPSDPPTGGEGCAPGCTLDDGHYAPSQCVADDVWMTPQRLARRGATGGTDAGGLAESIAAVLAEHQWSHTATTHCACGFRTPLAQLAIEGYLTHVAAAVAAHVEALRDNDLTNASSTEGNPA